MPEKISWQWFALGSAFFAGLTAIFGKLGVAEINSNLATFIRTTVALLMSAILITGRGEWEPVNKLSAHGILMLCLSGIATGLSWLCYYRALQTAEASKVAPIDKLSVVFVIVIAWFFLGEQLTLQNCLGAVLIVVGVLLLI
jgi:bacterial/archaeal transporter family protein